MMKKSQAQPGPDLPPVASDRITDAFVGACTNGRYDDLVEVAKVLRGKKVHPDVSLIVIPASRKVYERAMDEGILQIIIKAGANVESSNCGPCFGSHMGVLSRNAQMISSSNRNYQGRMGSRDARIFLGSPATVAASAIEGRLADPRKYL
jgi:3-isopropylmalate/(R)-2-methylmalate dehydratase large subunit